jgi:hypothetical protein
MERSSGSRFAGARVWLIPFSGLVLAGLALLAITAWVESLSDVWLEALFPFVGRLETAAAIETLSNAAEVVAAVLAIAITVVAIVVELAANRYTHRITELFVSAPANSIVMGFFVLTALHCMWVSATLSDDLSLQHGSVAMSLAMVTLSLMLLLPYFAFVFVFLQPLNVVDRIRAHASWVVERATRGYQHGLRAQMVTSIEQLEDVALNAMEHKDRGISLAAVEGLHQFLRDYEGTRDRLADAWFDVDRSLVRDPSFIAMAPQVRDDLTRSRTWVEMKVLRQYHTLYVDALNRMRGVAYLISLNTHRLATTALEREQPAMFDLTIRIFNTYLRAGINARDVRTTYYTLHHYRGLAEDAVRLGRPECAVEITAHLRYYGQTAFAQSLSFILEAVAYDIAQVCESAFVIESPAADELLDLFLTVDESDAPGEESTLRGVRRSQVQLATFFLDRGDEPRARRVWDDMRDERPERLASIRDELLAEDQADYWEITDRGVNFGYLPPARRARVPEFFAWFGDRVPPPAQEPEPAPEPALRARVT